VHVPSSVVVRIEEICVLWNFGAVTWTEFLEDESFEKPRRMSEMPLRRADIRHRLHNAILWFKACAKRSREIPDLMKTSKQAFNTR